MIRIVTVQCTAFFTETFWIVVKIALIPGHLEKKLLDKGIIFLLLMYCML